MAGTRKPSAVTRLLSKRAVLLSRAAGIEEKLSTARAAHDPQLAHPKTWSVFNPWLQGCADCEREQTLLGELYGTPLGTPRSVRQDHLAVLRGLADAVRRAHKKRLAGQRKTAVGRRARPLQNAAAIARYCRENGLSPKQRGAAKQISAALSLSPRTVQRALKANDKK